MVVNAKSRFSNNTMLSGDLGSTPNELISLDFIGGLGSVKITGLPGGGSFVLDDLEFSTSQASVPEPNTLALVASYLGFARLSKKRHSNPTPKN
jgi:hypothetical protein